MAAGRIDRVLNQAETGALVVRSPDVLASGERVARAVDRLTWTVAATALGALAFAAHGAWVWVAGLASGAAALALCRRSARARGLALALPLASS